MAASRATAGVSVTEKWGGQSWGSISDVYIYIYQIDIDVATHICRPLHMLLNQSLETCLLGYRPLCQYQGSAWPALICTIPMILHMALCCNITASAAHAFVCVWVTDAILWQELKSLPINFARTAHSWRKRMG